MAEGRRGLGRGLSALLDEAHAAVSPERRREAGVTDLPIELIRPNPDQPRKRFDPAELDELAASIGARGVLQPILVRPLLEPGGGYEIVAGERRWRAAQQARLRQIPALVRDLSPVEVMEVALIENIQRADLNALEEARAYQKMAEQFGRGPEQIAEVVGKSRSHVANTLRLMRLPAAVQAHLEAGRLSAGHARALLEAEACETLAETVVARGLNVRQTEALARHAKGRKAAPPPTRAKDVDTMALESDLAESLGMGVTINDRDGAGEVVVAYRSLEQLDEIARRLITRGPAAGPDRRW
jgi:ParB family chromosome partitioning protein